MIVKTRPRRVRRPPISSMWLRVHFAMGFGVGTGRPSLKTWDASGRGHSQIACLISLRLSSASRDALAMTLTLEELWVNAAVEHRLAYISYRNPETKLGYNHRDIRPELVTAAQTGIA